MHKKKIACLLLISAFLLLTAGCYTQQEENTDQNTHADPLAACQSACEKSIPHSFAKMVNGSCRCPCEKGYRTYNNTCITPEEYRALAPVLCPKDHPVLKDYEWSYKKKEYNLYLCYENKTENNALENRTRRRDYWNFAGDPYSDASVSIVTNMLANISGREGMSKYEQVEFAMAFVQGLPYTFDNVSTPYDDYPRYPSETIYADGGDCEDTAILMAAMLKKMGYDSVLLLLPRHMAVGVYCDPADFDYNATYYQNNGRDYCYLETAGDESWKVGVLPKEYQGVAVEVIPLRSPEPDLYLGSGRPSTFKYVYSYNSHDMYVNVTDMHIDNFGTLPAKNAKIDVALEATEEGKVWSQYTVEAGDIPVRGYYDAYVTNLHAPTGESFRISVVVHGDNVEPVESKSSWVTWH